MARDVWAATESDGDRLIRRHAKEMHDAVSHTARQLKELAQVSDADASRRKRVLIAQATAETLRTQLGDLSA